MADGSTTSIDPRFDPRYQRGYAGNPVSQWDSDVAPTPRPVRPTAVALSAVGAAPEDASITMPATEADSPIDALLLEEEPADSERGDPWFIAAWVVSTVVLAVGVALFWASLMSENYSGPTAESDRLLQYAGWTIAPAMVQGGVLALVGMLVWTGVRHVHAAAARSDEEAEA